MITIDELYAAVKSIDCVDALALGGSRASGNNDEKSDYDLYVYGNDFVPVELRREKIEPLCEHAEIGNSYFEPEDNIILKGGTKVDIIYRRLPDIDRMLDFVFIDHAPRNGYTTCFWHNVKTSIIIFDKSGTYTKQRERAQGEYPEQLAQNIIERNMKLLTGYMPSYDDQIKKAYGRHDLVSVNHRVAAFLESYFDVIFALNRLTHPGEKRLIQLCMRDCKILPENFNENLMRLFEYMFRYDVSDILEDILTELKKVV